MKKYIKNYENLYYADENGNIYSKDRIYTIKNPNPKVSSEIKIHIKGKILKPHLKQNGYFVVTLCKNGTKKEVLVHRIIAETFLENPDNLPQVNHKDEDKQNNCVSNLEWCTGNYNYFYGTGLERRIKNQHTKKVFQFNKNKEFVNSYNSIKEAEKCTGIRHYNIISVCKGKRKTAGGFVWSYIKP